MLFVYGSLLRQCRDSKNYLLADYSDYVSDGYMCGQLYALDGYPGAVVSKHSADQVFGELYAIRAAQALFTRLDDYEECAGHFPEPHEYRREAVLIERVDGVSVQAWVYVYNLSVAKLERIVSGDYRHQA